MLRHRFLTCVPIFALTAACGCLGGMGCSRAAEPAASPPAGESATPAQVTYTCPMHADVIAHAPGDCPKCGMALVVKK